MIRGLGALIIDLQNTTTPIKFFVTSEDGRLFEHHWSIPDWKWLWKDHGTPDGTKVATGPGAIIIDPQNTTTPIKFFVGVEDGRLVEFQWNIPAKKWLWSDTHDKPDGTKVATAPGALIVEPNIGPKFFVGTEDGRLFEHLWDIPTRQWLWADHGMPDGAKVATAPGALIFDSQNTTTPIKFFVGTLDGRLFERQWDVPSNQWLWYDHSYPVAHGTEFDVEYVTPGALIVEPQRGPKFFIIGRRSRFTGRRTELRPTPEGVLLERMWDIPSQQWVWVDHGTPTPHDYGSSLTAPGALIIDPQDTTTPIKFFVGTQDGRLFEHHWSVPAGKWEWADHDGPYGYGKASPWAILLCKFKDDASEPYPFEFYERLFTLRGITSQNLVDFFLDISHKQIDLSYSRVFGWLTINKNKSDYKGSGADEAGQRGRQELVDWAKDAATQAGINLGQFYGVVVYMNVDTDLFGSMGPDGKGQVVCSYTGILDQERLSIVGQEMGHGYGLEHSRREGSAQDYQDRWDVMSTEDAVYMAPHPEFRNVGPALNAWNMRGRGWLDETRVWKWNSFNLDTQIELRPLLRPDLPGFIAAELPGGYLIEYRPKEGWDAAIPRPAILVHRFEKNQSYIMAGLSGQYDLVKGDVFQAKIHYFIISVNLKAEVINIDTNQRLATIHLTVQYSLF